ncbi:glycoside hydrolase family 6 protein [Agromyces mediolanus]|uniref:glycoside hydrolase family 6 protein n=1 Tax=Agromyces mediolanus TaxID=41986 RepID=UPI0022A9E093|nr:glycoside hydrolase family 6 protein [Agromyces mediolanus]MCD1572574.1 glycoside hydrolase family 6 protein [Agromyces mediolanus]
MTASGAGERSRTATRRAVLASGAIALLAMLAACAPASAADSPFAGRTLYRSPDSSAAIAARTGGTAAEREAAAQLAERPTATWLIPERLPAGEVGPAVDALLDDAAGAAALPVLVVYGIPDRDCGGHSAGGLARTPYLAWIDEIAAAIGERSAVVVLEPDALALAEACPDAAARPALVREAAARLPATTAVYLDGGHSAWLPAERMAELLRAAGVDRVRGFATNVSNTRTTSEERAYAHRVAEALGGGHAVIDVSRNGSGPPADASWCNVPGRTVGEDPGPLDDEVVDAVLWLKPPGESDGTCNGGPPAGQWWPEAAIALTGGG